MLRPRQIASVVLAVSLAGGSALASAATDDLRSLLPAADQLPAWRLVDPPRIFTGDDLFDLIDGGADLYLEYGFSQVISSRYEGASSATLQIEVYQMRSAAAAYGIYSITQSGQGTAVDIGQAARLFDYYLVLWKGPYYVSVTASGSSPTVRNEVMQAARLIAARIKATGIIPPLAAQLPKDGLLAQKYFCGNLGLATIYAFGAENPFKVQEGVCGFYPGLRLFILRYPTAEQAAARLTTAREALAQTGTFQHLSPSATGFDCTDSASNRISVRLDGASIKVRIQAEEALATKPSSRSP
jgi:hypothetical protein